MFILRRFGGLGLSVLCASSLFLALPESSSAGGSLPYAPTTTVSAQTSNNTSASSAFTDIMYSFNTKSVVSNSNGDMVPANISKIPVSSLLSGAAASAPVWVETQTWFCTSASNLGSGGLLNSGTGPKTPVCGSHIDVGYNSGDATQIANTAKDLEERGISGVIMDWNGPPALSTGQTNVQNNNSIDQMMDQADASGGKLQFAVQEDEGVAGCAKGWWACRCADGTTGSSCNATTQAIYDINYLLNRWAGSSSYLHVNGSPVVPEFGLDSYATIDWSTLVAGLDKDPVTGKAPILLFENSGGMTHVDSGGAYSWLNTTDWVNFPGSDPFSLNWLASDLSSTISHWSSDPSQLVIASAFKGFDDTVVNGWGSLSTSASDTSRYIDQQCGLTWIQSFAQVSKSFSAKAPTLISIPTWDDYEEATEIQTGIDNCLTGLNPSISGSVVSWNPTFGKSIGGYSGNESTVHHYVVYVSQDGQNLMPLPNVASGTHSLDLSQYGLPAGAYQVFVQAVGQPMIRNTFASVGNYSAVATGGTISGQVTDASSQAGVSGATVTFSGGSTTTDSTGQYSFSNVSAGSYTLQVTANGYLANSGTVSVTAGQTSALNVAIATAGTVSGTVVSSTGSAIAGASVVVSGGVIAQTLNLTASSTGAFSTSWIPVGNYTATCSAPGYNSGSATFSLAAGQNASVTCTMTSQAGTITGQITDASTHSAISGATVSYSGGSTTTNSSGQYTLSGVAAGTYTVQVAANGYLSNTTSVGATAGQTSTANVAIATAGQVSGSVVSSTGAALTGASVKISGGVISTTLNLTSGTSGTFSTGWIPVGSYTASCSLAGYNAGSASFTVTAGSTVSVTCTMTSQAGTITGQITDASTHSAISGATVSYSGGSTTTNSSGQYSFTGVQAGSYTIQSSASGYLTNSASVSVTSGQTSSVNVKIATAGVISGTVLNTSGVAVSGASVTIKGGVISTTKSITSGTNGSFSSSWIPVGSYTVTCTSGSTSNSYSLNLTAGETYSLSCKL